MTSVTSQAQQYSQRKLRLKRWVFRRLQKTGTDCADVTWCGRLCDPIVTHGPYLSTLEKRAYNKALYKFTCLLCYILIISRKNIKKFRAKGRLCGHVFDGTHRCVAAGALLTTERLSQRAEQKHLPLSVTSVNATSLIDMSI